MASGSVGKIEFNSATFEAILKSPGVQADMERRLQAMAAAAGPGVWDVEITVGPARAHGRVSTGDSVARKAEATNRSLTSALGAGA